MGEYELQGWQRYQPSLRGCRDYLEQRLRGGGGTLTQYQDMPGPGRAWVAPGPGGPWSALNFAHQLSQVPSAQCFAQHQFSQVTNFWKQGRPANFHLRSLNNGQAELSLTFQLPSPSEIIPPPSPYSTTPLPTSIPRRPGAPTPLPKRPIIPLPPR